MKKILILVQSFKAPPYGELLEAQKRTWDSIHVPGVDTIYYYGGDRLFRNGKELMTDCPDDYNMMHWKYKLAIDYTWDWDWDLVFRTNSSSYVNKTELQKFAERLGTERVYCGMDGGNFASGCGVYLSRDCVKIFKDEFTSDPSPAEDCMMGSFLLKHGIGITPGAERVDYYFGGDRNKVTYHYRCKSPNEDRTNDVKAFEWLFEQQMKRTGK